jgi:hypothetical protein
MYDSLDCDDATAEALLAGAGQDIDPALARVLDLVRLSYAATPPIVGAELGALIGCDRARTPHES